MNSQMITCPGCGERVSPDMTKCPRCRGKLFISSFADVKDMSPIIVNRYIGSYKKIIDGDPNDKTANMSIAVCYLKLKVYDKAQKAFDKAIEDNYDNSEAYFYSAVCLLNGKKAFLTPRSVIDKICEYINAAIMIEPRGVYYLFSAYVKYDYFARKSYNVTPNFASDLARAKACGLSAADTAELFSLLGVERPAALI